MTTDYDPIAEQYKRSKLTPWRTHIEAFTLLDTIGSIGGLSLLDVACGEGFYTRILKFRGAARMTGVDLSQGMVDLARRQEAEQPLGIEYVVGDGRHLPFESEFDLVVAAYLLNYASTRDELLAMCRGIVRALRPGARFVTVNSNPACHFPTAPAYRQYGFTTTAAIPWIEGTPITWTFHLDDGDFSIENYNLSVATHEEALREAGFRSIRWHQPRVAPQGVAEFGTEFWQTFLKCPPITILECSR